MPLSAAMTRLPAIWPLSRGVGTMSPARSSVKVVIGFRLYPAFEPVSSCALAVAGRESGV